MISGVNYTMTDLMNGTWRYDAWTPTTIGIKAFRIYANDSLGNVNQFNDNINVVDTTPPELSIRGSA